MELELVVRASDKHLACDLGYADGETKESGKWFRKFSVPGKEVDPLIPDRPPDLVSAGLDSEKWWKLPDGTIVSKIFSDNDSGGYIIPPDADSPPPIKGYKVPEWVPSS